MSSLISIEIKNLDSNTNEVALIIDGDKLQSKELTIRESERVSHHLTKISDILD